MLSTPVKGSRRASKDDGVSTGLLSLQVKYFMCDDWSQTLVITDWRFVGILSEYMLEPNENSSQKNNLILKSVIAIPHR